MYGIGEFLKVARAVARSVWAQRGLVRLGPTPIQRGQPRSPRPTKLTEISHKVRTEEGLTPSVAWCYEWGQTPCVLACDKRRLT